MATILDRTRKSDVGAPTTVDAESTLIDPTALSRKTQSSSACRDQCSA